MCTFLAKRQQVLREAASVLLNKEVITGEELRAIAARGEQADVSDASGPVGRPTDADAYSGPTRVLSARVSHILEGELAKIASSTILLKSDPEAGKAK